MIKGIIINKKPKVFIIEDNKDTQNLFKDWLGEYMEILPAYTIQEAKELFAQNKDFDAIAIDGCVPGIELNTIPLIQEIRKNFKGTMITTSSDPGYRKEMIAAGCNEECVNKWQLPEFLLKYFNK